MTDKVICDIYRSPQKDELYLYVPKAKGLSGVPAELLEIFGAPAFAFTLVLTPERKLAKEDIQKVLAGLKENDYFLQLPPTKGDDYMKTVTQHNSKLS